MINFIQQHSLLILVCCLVCVLPVYNGKDSRESSILERILVALNYVWYPGLFGFICLISNVIKGGRISPFLQYHIFQSFFLVMLFWLLSVFVDLVARILYFIPLIKNLVPYIIGLFVTPIVHLFVIPLSIVSLCVFLLMIYLAVTSIQGQYSYIPWVSDIIKRNVRR